MRRTLTATTVTLALLGTGFYAAPATASPPADDRVIAGEQRPTKKPKKGKRSPAIVSPKPGQSIGRHTATVTVRAPYGVRKAQLNTTRLRSDEFELDADGIRRTVKVSSSHGLKHGRNTVSVTINKRYKGTVTKTVRFRIKGKQLLTGAGRDRRFAAGTGITLKGAARLHPSMRDRSTSHSWTIVRKPMGSNPTLLRPNSRKPRLKTDLPGKYVVRNTASMGRKTAAADDATSTLATLSATLGPMVAFDAWAADSAGNPGIRVGGRFYPGNLPLSQSQWQVLILDRKTLGVAEGDNRTYAWVAGTWYVATKPGTTSQTMKPVDIEEDLEGLSSKHLVVMVHRSQFAPPVSDNPFAPALRITMPKDAWPVGDLSAAIVAVPGGGVHAYTRETAGKVDFSGYMMQDAFLHYTFVDDARVPFDTRSDHTCDATSCTATVTVGGEGSGIPEVKRSFTAGNGRSGLGILRFDRRTLAFRDSQFVLTNGTSPDNTRDVMQGVTAYLKSLPDDDLVIITSVSSPGASLMSKPSPIGQFASTFDGPRGFEVQADAATQMGNQIARLGGTRHRFLQSGIAKDDGYTLVGYPGLPEGQGNETHAEQARLSGVLERDERQMFTPKAVSPGKDNYDTFMQTVMTAPGSKPWPGENDPAFTAVLKCLAKNNVGMNKENPRLSYLDASIKLSSWTTWATAVRSAKPGDCPDSDPAKFVAARDQFAKELTYVTALRDYISKLQEQYDTAAVQKAMASISKISSELKASSDEIKAKSVSIDWWEIIAIALEAVAPFLAPYLGSNVAKALKKAVEEATHAISAAIAGSIEFSISKVESTETGEKYAKDDEFNVEVGELPTRILDKMNDSLNTLTVMGTVTAADYMKLSKIGKELAKCEADASAARLPGTPEATCDPAFYVYGDSVTTTPDTLLTAKANAARTAEATIYKKVLPLTYPLRRIPWNGVNTQGDGTPEGNWDASLFTCFNATPFPSSWPDGAKPFLRRSLGSVLQDETFYFASPNQVDGARAMRGTPQFDTYVISSDGNRFTVDTAQEAVERLFGENFGSTDPSEDGLGADPVDYVLDQIQEGKVAAFPISCGGFSNDNTTPAPLDR